MKITCTVTTQSSLVERLKHWSDNQSWQDFYRLYSRLIYTAASHAGLSDAESQEVVQETLISVANKIGAFSYDPGRGSFKTWLLIVTRWRILKQFNKRELERQHAAKSVAILVNQPFPQHLSTPADGSLEEVWEEEWRRSLYDEAVAQVKRKVSPSQFQLFDLGVTQEWSAKEIARKFGINITKVYMAKHRVSRLIEKEVRRLEKNAW